MWKALFRPAAGGVARRLPDFDFNLSRSGNVLGLVLMSGGGRVGIDLEIVSPDPRVVEVASSAFSRRELNDLLSSGEDERVLTFYRIWTKLEARAKMEGTGLAQSRQRREDESVGEVRPFELEVGGARVVGAIAIRPVP